LNVWYPTFLENVKKRYYPQQDGKNTSGTACRIIIMIPIISPTKIKIYYPYIDDKNTELYKVF
jgi:hypothetical protein